MSKQANAWDPRAWRKCSPEKVSFEGEPPAGAEVVRAPDEAEVRLLQKRVPEIAGECLFVIEREPGDPSPLPVLPAGVSLPDAEVLLVNAGYVSAPLVGRQFAEYHKVERQLGPSSNLVLYASGRISRRSGYSWKRLRLWESAVDGTLAILHAWDALEATREFGNIVRQLRPDPGFCAACASGELTYGGDPASTPPLNIPAPPNSTPEPRDNLAGFAPRRPQTTGEEGENYHTLIELYPRLKSACFWMTGPRDTRMTTHGFCLARVLDDPSLIDEPVDATRFQQPPWVPVADPAGIPAGAVLVALFTGSPGYPPHAALRSAWTFEGETLYEGRIDFGMADGERPIPGVRILHPLAALEGGASGSVSGYYTLAP